MIRRSFLLALPLNPCSPLSTEHNARFNGIRLPSVERVDLTFKAATPLVEWIESLTSVSTGLDTSESTTRRIVP